MTDIDSGINSYYETSESGSSQIDSSKNSHLQQPEIIAMETSAVGKITCGDLVIHPMKPWPWIGTVQPKVGNFARLCSSCGGLRVPSSVGKDTNTQYKIRIESEEGPVPLCESEHEDSPAIFDEGVGAEGRCFGDCHEEDDEHMINVDLSTPMPKASVAVIPMSFAGCMPGGINHLRDEIMPPPLVALSVEGALPGRHFQVNWYPSGEVTDMDEKEKVVVPFKLRSIFQEGSPVAREGALNDQGLVKKVHRNVDAFVLPGYAWVIRDLPANKLKPLMDLEQCPGCFVIYKGWVGTVYNVWYRITFRLEDGTEFTLTDDQGEIAVHMREENRKAPCADIYQMYPGMKVRLRWMVLDNAKWPEGFQPTKEIQSKIKRSRERWSLNDTSDVGPISTSNQPTSGQPQLEAVSGEQSTKNDGGSMFNKKRKSISASDDELEARFMEVIAESEEALDIHIPGATKHELAAIASAHYATHSKLVRCDTTTIQEDMAVVTVVKLEPVKVDVEWLSQVVPDIPSGPKGNVIEGEELKSIYVFRSTRIFEPFDLGIRYRYVVQPGDNFVPAETWRQQVLDGTKDELSNSAMEQFSQLPPPPAPGDCIFVAIGKSNSKIDILWENGQFETGVDPETLVAQYTNQTERDYFPAMYVTYQTDPAMKGHSKGHSHRGKSDSGMEDVSQATRTSGENVMDGLGAAQQSSTSHLPSKFGIVKKAKNSEKFATVAWYEMRKKGDTGEPEEPEFQYEEDVSFYDLKFYYEFNYVGGTLVSRMDTSSMQPGMPNVGYVLRKNPDASVHVVWYDGKEEMAKPWKLRQLTTRYDSEYTPSDVDDEQHYYSPTEHEYEDLEDFRYYDYTKLSTEARQKRIGLIVAVTRQVISRLCSLTLALDNYFPYADRKKLVKLTLSCNDVCNGFSNLLDFRDTIKEMFENEQQQIANDAASSQSTDTQSQKWKLFKGRFIREERLVWQCANWLYDWTEAMTTLHADMKKYRNKVLRDEAATKDANSVPMDTTPAASSTSNREKLNEENVLSFVADLQSAIEAGLSTVTGILSVPPESDVDGGIVADYLRGLNDQKEDIAAMSAMDLSSIQFATFQSSHKFLRTLVENPTKVGRLPCFSYTHHSELELSALYKQWPASQFVSTGENPTNLNIGEQVNMENVDGWPKTCQGVVDSVGRMIEDVLHGRKDISYADDDVLKLCNETADALCLSVLSIMIRIIESIYIKLRPQIETSLTETPATGDKEAKDTDGQDRMDDDIVDLDQWVEEMGNVEGKTANVKDQPSVGTRSSALVDGIWDPKEKSILNGALPNTSISFELLSSAPASHRFASKQFDAAVMPKAFSSAVRREIKLLHSSLPPGIFVKTYEDRMDLFSCMIIGPQGTPYADGMFFFDVRLKDDYPTRPPHLFYKSMSKLLNPNLYEDGMVCLSLLGTWDGKETELWTSNSTLLQVFISIQSLILVPEPYFNEPGFEKEKGSQTGATKSRDYNEAAVLRTLESLQRALNDPPEPFRNEIRQHIVEHSGRLLRLLDKYQDPHGDNADISFPLFPVTQGFCLCIKRHAENLRRLTERWSTGTV